MKKINFFLIPLILSACATSKKVEIANDLLPVLDTSVSYTLKRSVIEVPNDSQTYKTALFNHSLQADSTKIYHINSNLDIKVLSLSQKRIQTLEVPQGIKNFCKRKYNCFQICDYGDSGYIFKSSDSVLVWNQKTDKIVSFKIPVPIDFISR